MFYCYRIVCVPTGKKYIGVTKNIEARWEHHIARLRSKDRPNWKLYNSMNKHGIENFKIEKISEKETLEEILEEEVRLIREEDTFHNGLNSTSGGEAGFLMLKRTEEELEELRKYCNSPEYLERLKAALNTSDVKKKHRESLERFWKDNEEAREVSRKAASKKHTLDISLTVHTSERFWRRGVPGSVCYEIALEFEQPRRISEFLYSLPDVKKRSHARGWINYMVKRSLLVAT